jgi:carbon-monoxide dehydrogenase medium subunit
MALVDFAYPNNVEEAVVLLSDPSRKAIPIGGGTALAQGARRGAEVLVDISRCALDGYTDVDAGFRLGAALTCDKIAHLALPGAAGRLLQKVAAGVASQPLRNAITLGGNVFHLASWSDFPVALLALDAQVHVAHSEGAFEMSMHDLVREHPQKALPPGALLTAFQVVTTSDSAGSAYRRFRTSKTDYSLATVAVLVEVSGKRCGKASICVGAVGPRPQRISAAEDALTGKTLSAETIARAAELCASACQVSPNYRMAPDVRRRILEVEVRRCIQDAVQDAQAGGQL